MVSPISAAAQSSRLAPLDRRMSDLAADRYAAKESQHADDELHLLRLLCQMMDYGVAETIVSIDGARTAVQPDLGQSAGPGSGDLPTTGPP
jgi:hypothetical protein